MLKTFLQGLVIGVANIIPGVSGGTMALVLGIYERLIGAIHNISGKTLTIALRALRLDAVGRQVFGQEMRRIDAGFLIVLGGGAGVAIVALASVMTYFLEKQHDPTYGFFWGLVGVSALVPYRMIRKKTWIGLLAALAALGGVLMLSTSMSSEAHLQKAQMKSEIQSVSPGARAEQPAGQHSTGHLLFLFVAGAIAISAMILPGISGSFLLLLMGGYFEILKAIAYRDFVVLAVFAAGCGLGLLAFTRLLNFLLRRWHDVTMSFLLGLVLGSLWAVWPFKTTVQAGGETIYLANRWPAVWAGNEWATLLATLAGGIIVLGFIHMEKKHPAA